MTIEETPLPPRARLPYLYVYVMFFIQFLCEYRAPVPNLQEYADQQPADATEFPVEYDLAQDLQDSSNLS